MLNFSRRNVLSSAAAAAAAFGRRSPCSSRRPRLGGCWRVEPAVGHYKYKVGSIEVTAIYDGIWRKPHDPAFIKGVSVDETKAALAKAGLTTDFFPIPFDRRRAQNRRQADHGGFGFGRRAVAGERDQSAGQYEGSGHRLQRDSTVIISHFYPDHVWGLMEKGTNTPVFPNAELIVPNATEYNWWTDPSPPRQARRKVASPPASVSSRTSPNGRTGSSSTAAPKSRRVCKSSTLMATRPVIRCSSSPSAKTSSWFPTTRCTCLESWRLTRIGRAHTIKMDRWRSRPSSDHRPRDRR